MSLGESDDLVGCDTVIGRVVVGVLRGNFSAA